MRTRREAAVERYDVVVVGGGAAGIAAAVAAARDGARTRLVERYGFLGGMATAGMVGTICGLYRGGSDGPAVLANEGIAAEFARSLAARGAVPVRRGRTHVLPYVPLDFAAVADALVVAEHALAVSLHTTCAGVGTGPDGVASLRLVSARGFEEVQAAAVVDSSGDAIVALLGGRATETVPEGARQLSSIVFVLQDVEPETVGGPRTLGVVRRLVRAETIGNLPPGASLASFAASGRAGEVVVKLALDALGEPRDDELTHAERSGRARVQAVAAYLRDAVPGFGRAFVSHVAPQVGVRETRRIRGRATLRREDVVGAQKHPDGIARGTWPIELWEAGAGGPRYEHVPDCDWYEIPRGCLESADTPNLFAAGRCLSATHEAMGSARVIGTCLATGEAAGRLAAAGRRR